MTLRELILKTRSTRRFRQDREVTLAALREIADLARISASASNLQPLKFILSTDPSTNAAIFPHTAWAGYLEEWEGPPEGERPAAWVIILGDTTLRDTFGCDHGIAAWSMALGAAEKGLGTCIIGSLEVAGLREALEIPGHLRILLALGMGEPAEEIRLEDLQAPGGDIRYWRDREGVHHVPKRPLEELVLKTYGE
ncbi:MAG: nitroreductase family protein [bacterium]